MSCVTTTRRDAQLSFELEDQLVDDVRADRVQTRRRLIVQDHLRIQGNRPGQGHPLSLAAREPRRIVVLETVQADHRQLHLDDVVDLPPVASPVVLADREHDVLGDRHAVEERPFLEEVPEVRADLGQLPFAQVIDPRPLKYTSPSDGLCRTMKCLIRTVLPQPLGPMMTVVLPFSMDRVTLSSTSLVPNLLVRLRTSMMLLAGRFDPSCLADLVIAIRRSSLAQQRGPLKSTRRTIRVPTTLRGLSATRLLSGQKIS